MQQSSCNFDAAALATAQPAQFLPALLGKPDAIELHRDSPRRLAMREPVQGAMVIEVLLDGQVEVERRLLEDDPDFLEAFGGALAKVQAEDMDRSFGLAIQPGDQRKQRGFPCAVQPEQHREIAGRNRKGDVLQYPALPKPMSELFDGEGRWLHHSVSR
jgi:hypothetical protein